MSKASELAEEARQARKRKKILQEPDAVSFEKINTKPVVSNNTIKTSSEPVDVRTIKTTNKYSDYNKEELVKEKKQIQSKMNKVTGGDKNADGKTSIGELFSAMVNSSRNKKKTNSKEYKKLKEEYDQVNSALNEKVVDESKISTIDKLAEPFEYGMEKATEGLNTTVQKIRNSLPDFMKTDKKEITASEPSLGDLYDEKVKDSYNSKLGKVYHDLSYTTGYMLPAMAAPSTGLSLAATGITSFGSAYKGAIDEGKTDKQATKYGAANAALEVGLQKVLGGISSVYGESLLGKNLKPKVEKVISNVIKSPAIRNLLMEAGGEFTEEYLQEILDPVVRNITLDENNEFKPFTKEALYSGILGALNSGLANSMSLLGNRQQVQNIINQKNEGKITAAQANEMLSQIQQGTYEQNQVIDRVAQERFNEINNSNLTQGQKADLINALNETVQQQRNNINSNELNEFNNYTQKEISNIQSDNVKIANNENDIVNFAKSVKEKKATFKKLYVGKVAQKISNFIKNTLGLDVAGYNISINKNGVEHSINQHGSESELLRGQVPINENDFKNIPKIVNEADHISRGYDTKEKKPSITFEKNIDGNNVVITYVSDKHHNLELQSMYKFKSNKKINPVTAVNESNSLTSTSKTNSDTDLSTNNISKNTKNVNDTSSVNSMRQNQGNDTIAETKSDEVAKITPEKVISDFDKAKKGQLDGKQMRSWVETSNEATGNQNTISKADIDKITYEVKSNKKTFEKAEKNIKNLSYEDKIFRALDKLNSNKKITSVDLVEAQIALREAATKGDIKNYLKLQQDIAIMGTELGQSVQALSMIQKMSPDGQLAILNKIVDRQQKLGNKNWEDVKLDEEKVKKVLESYDDETHTTYNQEKLDNAVEDLKQDIADQIKTTWSDKANEWRYLSMLGNPKTHIRNIVANVAMSGVKTIKDFQNSALQDLLIKDKSNKTTTLKKASNDVKELAKVISDETFKGENTNKYNEKNDIESKKKVFNNKILESARRVNMKALDVEDRVFKERNFKKSFEKYLTAQDIVTTDDINANPEIIQQAKNFALEEAKIATFQQDNNLASWINSFDNKGKIAKVVRGAIIPFTRTPLNIAKTGIEYTPGTGLLKTISDVKKAPSNMKGNVLIDGMAKQMTGTSLALVGYALAKSGLVTADTGDDKLETDQGMKMGYSIKIGDKSYDLSWLSPSSMPFFVGAEMYEQLEKNEGWDGNVVLESLAGTLDPLSEMSCISSFTDVLKSYNTKGTGMISDIGKKTSQNYLSQFVPTLSSQFARLFDDTKRSTYADKNSSFTFGQETVRQLMYKIPGLRNKLSEQTDYLGNSKKENDNVLIRAFESFLSPANTKLDTSNETTKYLLNLYKQTGESSVLPGKLDQYIEYNNQKYKMTQKEYNTYKKDYGEYAYDEIEQAIHSDDYKSLSKDEQAEVISNIMKYSKYKAKEKFLNSKDVDYSSKTYSKAEKAEESGYAIADFYINKQLTKTDNTSSTSDRNRYNELKSKGIDGATYDKFKSFVSTVKSDKDANGKTINGSKKQKIINYINSLPLTPQQKQNLYDDYLNNSGVYSYYK